MLDSPEAGWSEEGFGDIPRAQLSRLDLPEGQGCPRLLCAMPVQRHLAARGLQGLDLVDQEGTGRDDEAPLPWNFGWIEP